MTMRREEFLRHWFRRLMRESQPPATVTSFTIHGTISLLHFHHLCFVFTCIISAVARVKGCCQLVREAT